MPTLTLKEKRPETLDVISFIWTSDQPLEYIPGQFMQYTLPQDNPDDRGIKRYFTISSAPAEGFIMLTTRFSPEGSSFKHKLHDLNIGATIQTRMPSGDFTYPDTEKEAVFIAGGIGITPYRSILKDLDSKGVSPKITLLYANKDQELPFKDEFDQMMAKYPTFKVIYHTGRVNGQVIKQNIPDLQTPIFYVSGPEPMVEKLGNILEQELGIPKDHFKQDFFPGYEE